MAFFSIAVLCSLKFLLPRTVELDQLGKEAGSCRENSVRLHSCSCRGPHLLLLIDELGVRHATVVSIMDQCGVFLKERTRALRTRLFATLFFVLDLC
jgi:hypothetical protein